MGRLARSAYGEVAYGDDWCVKFFGWENLPIEEFVSYSRYRLIYQGEGSKCPVSSVVSLAHGLFIKKVSQRYTFALNSPNNTFEYFCSKMLRFANGMSVSREW